MSKSGQRILLLSASFRTYQNRPPRKRRARQRFLIGEILPFEDYTRSDISETLILLRADGVVECETTPDGDTTVRLKK